MACVGQVFAQVVQPTMQFKGSMTIGFFRA